MFLHFVDQIKAKTLYSWQSYFLTGKTNPNPSLIKKKFGFVSCGLGEKIRTSGLLNPIQARYQTALHPDKNQGKSSNSVSRMPEFLITIWNSITNHLSNQGDFFKMLNSQLGAWQHFTGVQTRAADLSERTSQSPYPRARMRTGPYNPHLLL